MKYKKSGFTLIELLVVIVIIALLSSIVAPKFFGKLDNAKVKTTEAQIEMLSTTLDAFRLDVGRYPTTEEGLKVLWAKSSDIKGWNGAYLPKKIKGDAWGKEFIYKVPGKDGNPYDLYSLGADGEVGGEKDKADISVWE
ncbi:General secretion pathway protein G [hydrothermal vent metagenome]|uniref:Type II secretion system core protein G n=1 Tax=hydrothermal vent metagenome TaxID=652676 RepID=A0A1W1EIG1_9ZZZZ